MSQDNESDRFDEFDRDDELRALLQSGDPATSLRPVDQPALTRLVAAASESSRGRRHRPLTWIAAAAAVAVVVTAGVGAIHDHTGGNPIQAGSPVRSSGSAVGTSTSAFPSSAPNSATSTAPSAAQTPPLSSSTDPTTQPVSRLSVDAAAFDARCVVPNVTTLGTTDTAFAGTVVAIDGRKVTLRLTDSYRGSVADTVTVRAPRADLSRLLQTVHFKVGGSFLVSAADRQMALCGLSGPAKPPLQALYSTAFAR